MLSSGCTDVVGHRRSQSLADLAICYQKYFISEFNTIVQHRIKDMASRKTAGTGSASSSGKVGFKNSCVNLSSEF